MRWFTTHYDSVLEELYRAFRDSGEATFGNWFFQNGGFHHFVHFVYVYSVLSSKLFVLLALVAAVGYMFLTKQTIEANITDQVNEDLAQQQTSTHTPELYSRLVRRRDQGD